MECSVENVKRLRFTVVKQHLHVLPILAVKSSFIVEMMDKSYNPLCSSGVKSSWYLRYFKGELH